MLNRYPDTVIVRSKAIATTNLGGLMGPDPVNDLEHEIRGRVQLSPNGRNVGYTAKFFTNIRNVSLFRNDGLTLEYQGRIFKIFHWQIRQTHVVLWLAD